MEKHKIKALGFDYTLIYDKNIGLEKGEILFEGQCAQDSQEIQIALRNGAQSQREVLVHELVELVNAVNGLELPHPIIQTIGAGIFALLEQNPILRKKLLTHRKGRK